MFRNKIISKITSQPENTKALDNSPLRSYYGINTFNDAVQAARLPKDVYKKLKQTIRDRSELDISIAEPVAVAMRDWAIEQGVTHYTHWFQPLTGSTAEKHDAFVTPQFEGVPIMEFSGKQLVKGEPDASSFPSGGLRSTFEARGYTAWDPTSAAYILKTETGGTLFIPTAYCSYSGEALDMKTPLLRSQEALSKSAVRLLKILGREVKKVYTTAGLEQEYFLIDTEFYNQRPDLIASGRTLYGGSPLKGQELSDHYFGKIPTRVLKFMQDSERALYELGVPVKTRHNEVAPNQFEIAPFFEDANVAIDHNLLLMSVMKEVAAQHGFRMLVHEKPFKGINGSGKHCNWSMADSEGQNLLDPGDNPHKNMEFIVFLACLVRAVDRWAHLLRVSIASASNDHRLGAHEAPPAIISIFMGDQLTKVIEDLISGTEASDAGSQRSMQLGVNTLPPLPLDNSDRNRTSPFAFTGNKFEFRALGSKQNGSGPNYTLNTAVAESVDFVADAIEAALKQGKKLESAATQAIKEIFTKHKRVIFNGDGYTEDWHKEAEKRGLPNLKTLCDAVPRFTEPEAVAMFEKYGVMNKREMEARSLVRYERYVTEIAIEVRSMIEIARTMILPAAIQHQNNLSLYTQNGGDKILNIHDYINDLVAKTAKLSQANAKLVGGPKEQAEYTLKVIKPAMTELRGAVDNLEQFVEDKLWPLPKYREMLSIL